MGFLDSLQGQFVDVIEHVDENGKLLVAKYERPGNEIKQGSQVIVREGQCAVFIKGGALADVMGPGTFRLTTENLPILSTLAAFSHGFNSPVKSDLYFVNLKQFVDNAWGTRNPVMMRDPELGMVRVRAFGLFGFRIQEPVLFAREVLAARHLFMTYDIVAYLSGIVAESVAATLANADVPVLEFARRYRDFAQRIAASATERARDIGISFTNVIVENVSLPDEVEKLIDEQSGIAMAKKDMAGFIEYQSARALRDAAQQESGFAGIGAGVALGNLMTEQISKPQPGFGIASSASPVVDVAQTLRDLKALVDEGILSNEEFEAKKKDLLDL